MISPTFPAPPKNNPPIQPLQRSDGRLYEVTVHVRNKKRTTGWPLLPESNWCEIQLATVYALNTKSQPIPLQAEENNKDSSQWRLQFPEIEYAIHFSPLVYASILDNQIASSIPWPESWNQTTSQYLQPSKFIESNDAVFSEAVTQNGHPRSVSIHIAAKVLIRYCLDHIESNGKYAHIANTLTTGIDIKGARYTIRNGKGSAADLVCVCVATLRAAGIPSRPVVGITNANAVGNVLIEPQYMVWGEYALPGAGWVPFVPQRMRGTVDGLSATEPWQGLGTLPSLNRRIPLSYNFICYDVNRSTQNIQMNLLSSTQKE